MLVDRLSSQKNEVECSPKPRKSWAHKISLYSLNSPTALQMSDSPFNWWLSTGAKSEKSQSWWHWLTNTACATLLPQCLRKLLFGWILGTTNQRRLSSWRKQNHRLVAIGRDSGDHLVHPPPKAGLPRAGCTGTCPVRFWLYPEKETPWPLWIT